MVIKKQPIISWLLDDHSIQSINKLCIAGTRNFIHLGYLNKRFDFLADVKEKKPEWGLPELVMPSFLDVMGKNAEAFRKIDHQLFQEFYKDNECGILISKQWGTIIYGFGEDKLHIWQFISEGDLSKLFLSFSVISMENNTRRIYTCPTILNDEQLFEGNKNELTHHYEYLTNFIMYYLAVKKYGPIETIVIPPNIITKLDENLFPYSPKEKIKNDSGQKVIIMDSRWFRKIVNDNEIVVRGFFRLQNKKNPEGKWYKELIYVDSYIRHGYHRNAIIEND